MLYPENRQVHSQHGELLTRPEDVQGARTLTCWRDSPRETNS